MEEPLTQFTSKAIEKSFIRLLNERPLDKITIKDITALLEHILSADVERVERYLYSIAGEVMRLYVARVTERVEHAAHKKVFPAGQKMVVDFYKFALVGMILERLNTGMKKDPESLIRRVGEIFQGNIEITLTRVAR